jgi:hypothetical protein
LQGLPAHTAGLNFVSKSTDDANFVISERYRQISDDATWRR